jgi:hypothetical protein
LNEDFLDFLRALAEAGARFLVVGAHALAVHGIPRATVDLDVWIDRADDNIERVWRALHAFGAPLDALGIRRGDLAQPDTVVQFGVPPRRVDLLTGITGVTFDEAWKDRVNHRIGDITVPFIGRNALVANKRATGRLKDLADVEALGELSDDRR